MIFEKQHTDAEGIILCPFRLSFRLVRLRQGLITLLKLHGASSHPYYQVLRIHRHPILFPFPVRTHPVRLTTPILATTTARLLIAGRHYPPLHSPTPPAKLLHQKLTHPWSYLYSPQFHPFQLLWIVHSLSFQSQKKRHRHQYRLSMLQQSLHTSSLTLAFPNCLVQRGPG